MGKNKKSLKRGICQRGEIWVTIRQVNYLIGDTITNQDQINLEGATIRSDGANQKNEDEDMEQP